MRFIGQLGKWEAEVLLSLIAECGGVEAALRAVHAASIQKAEYAAACAKWQKRRRWWRRWLGGAGPKPVLPDQSPTVHAGLALNAVSGEFVWVATACTWLVQEQARPEVARARAELGDLWPVQHEPKSA